MLQGAEVVDIAKRFAQSVEDDPVAPCAGTAQLLLQTGVKVDHNTVAVEQCVVNVQQEDHFEFSHGYQSQSMRCDGLVDRPAQMSWVNIGLQSVGLMLDHRVALATQ